MKNFTMKILNGMSLGIVVALIPSALLGELFKALGLVELAQLTGATTIFLPAAIGIAVAYQFSLNPMQSITLASATMIGSGVIKFTEAGLVVAGTGDVINAGITCAIAVLIIRLIDGKGKNFAILFTPILVSFLGGFIGLQLLPYVAKLTGFVGMLISEMTTMQPLIMGILIAMSFTFLIISPFSTVGIALAVGLGGIASGAANLGIVAASFGLAVGGFQVNGLGLSLAPILGSPKIHMPNLAKNPKIIIPLLANSAILGALAAIFTIEGTAFSAGFGISGLIGPVNALNIMGWSVTSILLVSLVFVVIPIVLSVLFKFLFVNTLKIISTDDYKLEV